MEITYAKGIYTLTDGIKTYTYNINNGKLVNTKTNNIVTKPTFKKEDMLTALKRTFNKTYIDSYCNMLEILFTMLHNNSIYDTFGDGVRHLTYLSIWDKLLNVLPSGYTLLEGYNLVNLSNKQISKIAKQVQAYNNPNEKTINLQTFINQLEIEELAVTYGNLPIDFVEKHKNSLKTLYDLGGEYRDIALYYYYTQKLYKLRNDIQAKYACYTATNYILTYIKCCKIMNKPPIKTNNFMREYLETLNAYDLWCETDKQNRFIAQYNKYKDNLLFEYGNYQVVLPQQTQDLITEGNQMHHCVGSYIDKVANGETLIVFIRHKDTPNKCYITAQIDRQNGKLGQYYLAYDEIVDKTEDIEFKRKYQEWLKSKQW